MRERGYIFVDMAPRLVISDFSTLNFRKDWRRGFQYHASYIQRLLRTDAIDTQYAVFGEFQGVLGVVLRDCSGIVLAAGNATELGTINGGTAYRVDWSDGVFPLPTGMYSVAFILQPYGLVAAEAPFTVVDELPDSVLLRVTNDTDVLGTIFNGQSFSYRVEGVWMPGDVSFQSDSQEFRDQNGAFHQLSSQPYETRVLTIGGGISTVGVPNWVGRKVNQFLACSSLTVDGVGYVRAEGTTVERTDISDYWPQFLYKVTLEPSDTAHTLPLPQQWLLAAEDGRIILTEDGKAIDMFHE